MHLKYIPFHHHIPYLVETIHENTFENNIYKMENAAAAVSKLFTSQPAEDETTSKTSTTSNASKDTSVPRTIPDDTPSARTSDVDVDSTVDQKINPTVEHRHVKKTHETEEQTRVERERHQDHYKTTIQPIKDSEIQAEKHDHIQETKYRSANLDDGRAKAKADADLAGVKNTVDQKQFETKSTVPTTVDEHVHHHLHETIQPVLEKGKFAAEVM